METQKHNSTMTAMTASLLEKQRTKTPVTHGGQITSPMKLIVKD